MFIIFIVLFTSQAPLLLLQSLASLTHMQTVSPWHGPALWRMEELK